MARSPNHGALRLAAVVAALGLSACAGDSAPPTAPTPADPNDILTLVLDCPTSLLIGQRAPCVAVAILRSGQTPVVSFDAAWSSTRSDVVSVDALGALTGRSGGQATVSASYRGRQATATVAVTVEDALRLASGQAHQGDFTPGSAATMWLQGYYSVASAATGRLSLRISDQNGIITTTTAQTVPKGGDFFLMSATFVIPQGSLEVCRVAVLEVGPVIITAPPPTAPERWCIQVRR